MVPEAIHPSPLISSLKVYRVYKIISSQIDIRVLIKCARDYHVNGSHMRDPRCLSDAPPPLASPRIKCYTISVGYTREWIMYGPLVAAGKLIFTSGREKIARPNLSSGKK